MTKLQNFLKGLIKENPVLVLVLGTCPTLAVSTKLSNAIGMGLAATVVLICSNMAISAMRKTITEKVFDRMVAERKQFADRSIAEGKSKAREIRISADRDRTIALAEAEAQAQRIRAEGDAKAAESYKTFSSDPELAEFLRKIEALRVILRGRTTIVFDTNVPPFDLLNAAKNYGKGKLPVVPRNK